MTIGQAIKARITVLCKEYNITMNELANRSGIPHSTVGNIVRERNHSATVATIQKLCDGFGISIIDFFNHELFRNIEQEIK